MTSLVALLAVGLGFRAPVGGSTFAKLPLEREADGLLSAVVPAADAEGVRLLRRDGQRRGRTATLPGAGAEAPQHARALTDWTTIDVGAARFGRSRAPSAVCGSSWGRGDAAIGLDSGREQSRIGPSASTSRPMAPSFYSTR